MKLKIRTALAVIALAAGTLTISACNDNTLEDIVIGNTGQSHALNSGEETGDPDYGSNGDTLRAEEQPIPEVVEEI